MNFPRQIKAVVFDMDGLLFDTEALFFEAMAAAADEQGYAIDKIFFLSLLGGNRDFNYLKMRERFGASFPAETFHDLCTAHMHKRLDSGLRTKPGVFEILGTARDAGLKCCIATSSLRENVERHLAQFDMHDFFDCVVANGDCHHGKPHPDPYLTAARILGVDAQSCLALEDSYNGVRSASSAGMMTIMVPDLLPATYEMIGLCAAVVDDLHAANILLREALQSPL